MPICSTPCPEPPAWFPLRWQLEVDPASGLQGLSPLPWWSAGWYAGELRQQLLGLRRQPDATLLHQVMAPLLPTLLQLPTQLLQSGAQELLLAPVPSGRRDGNPVPALLASALAPILNSSSAARGCTARVDAALLQRSCRVAIQHHLNRRQRWRNQWLSFRALLPTQQSRELNCQVLLVDDVLTSGATALAAQRALQSAGWHVAGLVCLGRTPR